MAVRCRVVQSLKRLSAIGRLVACKERSVLQDQHLLQNPGLHFVSSGLRSLGLGGAILLRQAANPNEVEVLSSANSL